MGNYTHIRVILVNIRTLPESLTETVHDRVFNFLGSVKSVFNRFRNTGEIHGYGT